MKLPWSSHFLKSHHMAKNPFNTWAFGEQFSLKQESTFSYQRGLSKALLKWETSRKPSAGKDIIHLGRMGVKKVIW